MLRPLAEIIEHKQQLVLHLAGISQFPRHGILDGIALHGQEEPPAGNGGFAVEAVFKLANGLARCIQKCQNRLQAGFQLAVQLGLEG
ncbi:hypothetical protein D3C71_1943850 [compost metagenome]